MQSTKYDIPIFEDEDIADLNNYSEKMANALEKQIDKFGSPLIYKGEVETLEDLNSISDVKNGEIYTVLDENKNYIFNGIGWIEYSSQINLEKVQLSKIYKASYIIAKTIEGTGKIHKLYGKPEGVGTTGAIEIISTKADSTSLKTITCKPLYCIKNNIGNIIAQDYIDFDRQKIVRQCGYITFDGSNDEDWVADTRNNRFFIAKPVDCLRSELDNITSICNKYELNNTETVDESYNIGASIYVKDLSCSDLASFKQSLSSNPMILIVALNTSYEEDIDCTCGITQYEGETTIYNTEGAELEVELTNNKAISNMNYNIENLQEKINKILNPNTKWIEPASGFKYRRIRKDVEMYIVYSINNEIKNGEWLTLHTLPIEYRPQTVIAFPVVLRNTSNTHVMGLGHVLEDGTVRISQRTGTSVTVNQVNFTVSYSALKS